MAVITPVKFYDLAPPGESARNAKRAHRRFRAGAYQAQHLYGRHLLPHFFGQACLTVRRRAKGEAFRSTLAHCLHDLRMRMAKDKRSPGGDKIDVALTIEVEDVTSLTPVDDQGLTAHRFPRAYGTIDTAGNYSLRAAKDFF